VDFEVQVAMPLENDPNPNPTIDTLCRYADAVGNGKEITIVLVDKTEVETDESR